MHSAPKYPHRNISDVSSVIYLSVLYHKKFTSFRLTRTSCSFWLTFEAQLTVTHQITHALTTVCFQFQILYSVGDWCDTCFVLNTCFELVYRQYWCTQQRPQWFENSLKTDGSQSVENREWIQLGYLYPLLLKWNYEGQKNNWARYRKKNKL